TLLVEAIKLIPATPPYFVGWLQLHGAHDDIIDLHRIRQGRHVSRPGIDVNRLVIKHPVCDILDTCLGQQIDRFVCFGQTRAFPATGPDACKFLYGINGLDNVALLVSHRMHGRLDIAVANEFPSRIVCSLAGFGIDVECTAVYRNGCLQIAGAYGFKKTPIADSHAVFMPGPVRDIGEHGLTHRRWQHRTRHGLFGTPALDIDDKPENDPATARKAQRLSLVDRDKRDSCTYAAPCI